MRGRVWISFDLGLRGDFEGMYQFLDTNQAKECGDNTATFWFDHEGEDLFVALARRIKKSVAIDNRSRVYAIYTFEGRTKGKFIFGRRKSPPWTGHAATGEDEEDESGE